MKMTMKTPDSKHKKKLIVTSALPYANGAIHIGHLVEYIQTDIWVRYWKLRGRDAIYLCADDTHGTPIMLRAQKEGIAPEELIQRMQQEHIRDFAGFQILFDNYYTTHSEENRQLSAAIYTELREGGHLVEKTIEQAHCPRCCMFLPDRFIRGRCPVCGAEDQYGDTCERCSKSYGPRDLIAPRCAQCGATPTWRDTTHVFFRLADFQDRLRGWLEGRVQDEIKHKLDEWFDTGLQDWDITRDAPYFGFEIPDRPGQYFYVWLDAPVGYMASTQDWCRRNGGDFDSYWRDEDAEIVHFIGKDIVYFHALFWPALLMGAGYRTPTRLCVHGFLTVGGEKMSKSRGTFITAESYLKFLDPQYLRFYYAAKLNARVDDLDLNLEDFVLRVNADMVGKIANIPSRVLAILHEGCGGRLGTPDAAGRALIERMLARRDGVAELYEQREFAQVTRQLTEMATDINTYLEEQKPWRLVKEDVERAREVCTSALNAYRVLVTLLQPILPAFGCKLAGILGLTELSWDEMERTIEDRTILPYERLADRVERSKIEAMLAASRPESNGTPKAAHQSRGKTMAAEAGTSTTPRAEEPLREQDALPR